MNKEQIFELLKRNITERESNNCIVFDEVIAKYFNLVVEISNTININYNFQYNIEVTSSCCKENPNIYNDTAYVESPEDIEYLLVIVQTAIEAIQDKIQESIDLMQHKIKVMQQLQNSLM